MIEQSNGEIINTIRDHIEKLVDDRNAVGICIFVQSANSKDSGLYMIGEIRQLEVLSALNSYFRQISS